MWWGLPKYVAWDPIWGFSKWLKNDLIVATSFSVQEWDCTILATPLEEWLFSFELALFSWNLQRINNMRSCSVIPWKANLNYSPIATLWVWIEIRHLAHFVLLSFKHDKTQNSLVTISCNFVTAYTFAQLLPISYFPYSFL